MMRTDKAYYIRAAKRAERKDWAGFGWLIAKPLTISFVVLFYIGVGWASYHNKPSFLGIKLAQGEERFSHDTKTEVYYNGEGKMVVWSERSGVHPVPGWIQWLNK